MVISLQIKISLSMKYSARIFVIFLIFFGEIKKTIEQFILDNLTKRLFISPFFSGRNPQKKYLSEKPLIEIAAFTAEGPGIG